MSNQEIITSKNIFRKGLNVDTTSAFKSNESYSYANNAVLETRDGNVGSLSSEQGNFYCVQLPEDYKVIGHQLLLKDEVLIFSTNNTLSEIGLLKTNSCKYQTLVRADLNFKTEYPISCLFRIKRGCDRIVYFTDNYNNYRVINLDDLDYYKDQFNNFVPSKFSFTLSTSMPTINNKKLIDSGGNLKYGAYQFALRYLDKYGNSTNWLTTSDAFYVYDNIIGGAKNIISDSSEIGVYPPTNKSIEIIVDNLDQTFEYYQYSIVEYTQGTGTVTSVKLSDKISTKISTYTYSGENFIGTTNIEDITVDKQIIHQVKTHEQIDNRLFLANLSSSESLDYAAIQKAAMKITSICRLTDNVELLETQSKKYIKTYMKDEVYAMGIQGELENGELTPVFHIPGRKAIDNTHLNWNTYQSVFNRNWDNTRWLTHRCPYEIDQTKWDKQKDLTTSNTYINVDEDVSFLSKTKDITERWEIYNTGFILNNISSNPKEWDVVMSYWESKELYPLTKDCTGEYVFGTDAGLPIRHHKFPDTNIIPRHGVAIEFDLQPFFDNLSTLIQYKVKKWRIVQALRTEENKTVLDKGLTTIREAQGLYYGNNLTKQDPSFIYTNEFDTSNSALYFSKTDSDTVNMNYSTIGKQVINYNMLRYYSPKTLFTKTYLKGSHMKVEGLNWWKEIERTSISLEDGLSNPTTIDAATGQMRVYTGYYKSNAANNSIAFSYSHPTNVSIKNASFITAPEDTTVPAYTEGSMPDSTKAATTNRNYTPDVFQIQSDQGYRITNPTNSTTFANWNPYIVYASIKDQKDVYSNLSLLTYFIPEIQTQSNNKILVNGGDSFITTMAFEISARGISIKNVWGGTSDEYKRRLSRDIRFMIVESDINVSMRHSTVTNPFFNKTNDGVLYSSDDICGSYFSSAYLYEDPTLTTANATNNLGKSLRAILSYYDPLQNSRFSSFTCKEFFGYNLDYSVHHPVKVYYPLSYTYDYCSNCKDTYPYRMVYSEKDFQETLYDNYKNIKANNYMDLDGSTGPINILFKDKDQLYAITDKSLYFVPIRPQTIQSNENTVYIGTGEVFSIAPRRISTVNFSYSGTNQIESLQTTEYGTFYADADNARIYLLRDGLKEVSSQGMTSFFRDYLPIRLKTDFEKTNLGNTGFNYTSTISDYAVGIKAVYDHSTKRYIVTKKDFKLTQKAFNFLNNYDEDNIIVYDSVNKKLKITENGIDRLIDDLNLEPTFFTNTSWTLSYNIKNECWDSFHSYIPYYTIGCSKYFLSLVDLTHLVRNELSTSGQIPRRREFYKHDIIDSSFQTYYGKRMDHVIEITLNENTFDTKILDAINLYSKTLQYDNGTQTWISVPNYTFDRVWIYTKEQSTGIKNVNIVTSNNPFDVINVGNNIYWKYFEKNYTLSNIRDYTIAENVTTTNGDYLSLKDNLSNININQSFFEATRIRDKNITVRLYFKPNQAFNFKITTDLITTNSDLSNR